MLLCAYVIAVDFICCFSRFADVCEATSFYLVETLRFDVASGTSCKDMLRSNRMIESVSDTDEEIVADQLDNHRFGMVATLYSFCSIQLIGGLQSVDIRNFLSVLIPVQPVLRDVHILDTGVQRAPVLLLPDTSTQKDEIVQMDIDQHPDSPSTSADSSLPFNANDIPTEEDSANDQLILPSTSTDISASFSTLRESISRLVANQTRDSRRSGDAHGEVMSKIDHVERDLLDRLAVQNQAFRGLIKIIRQEAHNDNDVLSIALKAVRAQNSILSTDLADVRQEGSDEKNGEVSSSHGRGQPPLDDRNSPRRGGGGSSGSSRRYERNDSSKRRSSSGGGGSGAGGETYGPYGPYKKNAEWWLYGKNQF
ncbi:Homomeric Acetyl-CoA Carboxylase (Hom-ACCase) [Dorcoceras hygrometricum]|uniref:Homomeric Acetyl-CoA Carboxylase (Hom-ACCase) n=1 Tax=Dorcoceras hygrometricum TaxID=472368 RepID=A0A2Z7CDT9_9LAMI|nr:Homomeric Acetyl-CoA Carboxylase (Hom-ACCase) [Dorcoceras hygrometricum]